MTIQTAIARFIQQLSTERNMAPRTVEAYRYELNRWNEFVVEMNQAGATRVSSVSPIDLKEYLAMMKEDRNCKPATIGRVVSSLRQFFAFLLAEGIVGSDPAGALRTPKKSRRLPVYLTAGEAGRLMDVPDHDAPALALRDRTIIGVLTMTGMRLSELVGLDLESIDFESGVAKVFGKGRKERLIPLNSSAMSLLREWINERPAPHDGCRALFLSRAGDRLSGRTVQYLVKKGVKRNGLDRRTSPHKLRHTFATTLYAEAVDLRDIQELLGHSSIASTSVYTHTNVDKVRAAVNKLKMRANS